MNKRIKRKRGLLPKKPAKFTVRAPSGVTTICLRSVGSDITARGWKYYEEPSVDVTDWSRFRIEDGRIYYNSPPEDSEAKA